MSIETTQLPFFVFGTLRTGEYNWERFLKGRTAREIPAILPAHKMYAAPYPFRVDPPLVLAARPGIIDYQAVYPFVTDASPESAVVGNLVYPLEEHYQQLLLELDDLEEYLPGNEAQSWYLRVVRPVQFSREEGALVRVTAWVYHGGQAVVAAATDDQLVPGGDWLARKHPAKYNLL